MNTNRLLVLLVIAAVYVLNPISAQSDARVLIVDLSGEIGVVTYEGLKSALSFAEKEGYDVVVLLINTPGGSMQATISIMDAIEDSDVPVVGYVYPKGARAWSAGTYILMATHIAAMAPYSIIGSCQPVQYDPMGGGVRPINDTKIINAATKLLVERAAMHNRNVTLAELFVKKNLNVNAEEAYRYGVIEVVAESLEELLLKIHGFKVKVKDREVTLNTLNAQIDRWSPELKLAVLKILSNPFVYSLLLFIGVLALISGLSSPGYGLEVIGIILLILGAIGVGYFEVNLAALALIGIGLVLILAELFVHTLGLLAITGIAAIAIGLILLFPPLIISAEWLTTFLMTITTALATLVAFFVFIVYKVLKTRRLKPFLGDIVGDEAIAVDNIEPNSEGFVQYKGEYWRSTSDYKIRAGEKVIIIDKRGPVLVVKPKQLSE